MTNFRTAPLALVLALAWATPQAMAQNYIWDISTNSGIQNGNGTWGTDNFWASTAAGTNNVAWTSTATAWFGGTSIAGGAASPSGNFTITVNGTQTAVQVRQIVNGAGDFTLTGGTLALAAGGVRADRGTFTVDSVITNSAATLQLFAATNSVIVVGGNNTYTATSEIRGAAGGTVRLNHAGALGTGSSVLLHTSSVLLDLNGFDISGKTITIRAGQTGFLGNTAATKSIWSGTVTLDTTGILRAGGTNAEVEISGIISGSTGSLQSFDGGTLRLSGTNTYNGVTTVLANSTLIVGNSSALGSTTSGTTISNSATLDLNGFNVGNEAITLQQTSSKLANSNTTTAATVGGAVTISNSEIGGPGNLTLSGVVSSATTMGFSKTGTGTLTLSGANTYSGTTTVSEGTLALSGSGTLGAGTNALTISGGNVDLGGLSRNVGAFTLGTGTLANGTLTATNYALTNAGSISASLAGSGGLTKTGAGTATLSASNTYNGTTTISAGSLRVDNANALGQGTSVHYTATSTLDLNGFDVSGKTITVNAGQTGFLGNTAATKSVWSGSVNLANATGFLRAGGTNAEVEISGIISGIGGLQSFDGGTLRVTGDNTYSGTTSVRDGSKLIVGHSNALGSVSHTNFIQAATLDLNGFDIGSRIITLQQNASRLVNDNTGSAAAVSGPVNMLTNRNNAQIGGDGNLTLSGALATQDGTGGGFTKVGAGTLTLSGANTYSGTTTLSAGVVVANQANALGTTGNITFDGTGTLRYTTNSAGTDWGARFKNSGGAIQLDTGTASLVTLLGAIDSSNTGGLVKSGAGALALGGANTYAGTTTVSQGILAIVSAGALGRTNEGTVVNSGAQLRLTNALGNFTVGNEALTISGTGAPTGGALRNAGGDNTWQGNITLAANATIAAASGSQLTINPTSGNAITAADFSLTLEGAGTNSVLGAVNLGTGGLTKTGTGIAILAASNSFTGNTVVNAGVLNLNSTTGSALGASTNVTVSATLLISQSGQVSDSAVVTLSGGTIQRGAGVSEVFGNLNITGSGILDFGTDAVGNLTFGTYQDNAATPSALLTLNNFLPGNSFTFSSTSFTTNSVGNYFTFGTGYAGSSIAASGSTFTITAIPEPSTYLAAAGLLAVLMWPSRRRLLKDAKAVLGLRRPMRDRLSASRS